MTDPVDDSSRPQAANVTVAKRALELKRKAAHAPAGGFKTGLKQAERAAAARSAAKSKPMLRK